MKRKGYTSLTIVILFLLISVNQVFGKCAITVSAVQASVSSCQANGIIQATLAGAIAGIAPNTVKYQISSPGFTSTLSANGGTIVAVPPGVYTVTAEYMCPSTNRYETATSAPVTMLGTYPGFDSQKIYVMTAGIVSSLKCLPTGSVPIHAEGGRTPYTARITAAAGNPTYVGRTYSLASAGTLLMDNLPAGTYSFDFTDGCYTVPRSFTIPELPISSVISNTVPSSTCNPIGSITINTTHTTPPYTITLATYPASYAGVTSFTSLTVPYTIPNLPAGGYTITVDDACSQQPLSATITPLPPSAGISVFMNTDCPRTGSITFNFAGGEGPYQLEMTAPNSEIYPPQPAGPYTIPTNLLPGTYTFTLTDKCKTQTIPYVHTLTASTFEAILHTIPPPLAANCHATSSADIKLDKGTVPYFGEFLVHPNGVQPIIHGLLDGIHTLSNLPVGQYEVEYTDQCLAKDTVKFEIKAEPLAVVATSKASMACGAGTGSAKLIVTSGLAPYTGTIEGTNPISPSSPISPTVAGGNIFDIQHLVPGDYKVTITDDCPNTITQNITIKPIGTTATIDIEDPMFDFFKKPTNSGPQCDTVRLVRNLHPTEAALDPDFKEYWVTNPNDYFEMAYEEDGGAISPWGPVVNMKDTVFHPIPNLSITQSYCDARTANRKFIVHFRLKNSTCTATMTDTVKFAPLKTSITGPTNGSCTGSEFTFTHSNTENGLFCYPFKWELMDKNDDVIQSGGPLTTAGPHIISGVKNGAYLVKFTEKNGCTWYADWVPSTEIIDSIRVNWSNNSKPKLTYLNLTCTQYDLSFEDKDICLPYQWELKTSGGITIALRTLDITTRVAQTHSGLLYNENYILNIYKDGSSIPVAYPFSKTGITKPAYLVPIGNHSFCLPDTAYGSIKIIRSGNAPFEKGSIISLLSSPANAPLITPYTIPATGIIQFFPFSTLPNMSTEEFVDLPAGLYEFEIEDTCHVKTQVSYTYERANVRNFKLEVKQGCDGIIVKPSGQLYIGNTTTLTYFSPLSAPPGVSLPVLQTIGYNAGYYLLTHSGDFTFQISHYNIAGACAYDTIRYTNVHKTLALDADLTIAFKCNDDSDGLFSVRQKNGIGPFVYSLYDDTGALVSNPNNPNAIGDFSIPNAVGGANYEFEVEDQGCNVKFGPEPIQMINLSDVGLAPQDHDLCAQSTLHLSASTLGKTPTFSWTGPNGFASTLQSPDRPLMTTLDSGVYHVDILPVGCLDPVKQKIRIGVIDPEKPTPPDTVLCHNNPSLTLNITPDPGYTIKWYANLNDDVNTVPAISAPTPSTATPTDFVYYAIQEHIALGCKSEKQEVKVKISDRPSSIITASAPDICAGSTAIVLVDDTKSDHKYVLYNPANTPLDTLQGNGNTINLVANEVLLVDQTYAIEVVNQYACPSFAKQPVGVEVIDVETLVKMPDFEICTQADLQLNSGDLGATTLWTWTGPNGFASTLQNPLRPTITVADSGVYKVAIQSVCPVVEQEIKVGVIDPQKPTPPDTVLCHNNPSLTLNITPDPGYTIKWYANLNDDVNTVPAISAPTPSTVAPTDFVYYAIQEHIALGCKSEKQEVKVKISDRPSSIITASAPDICAGSTAIVLVDDTKSDHKYVLYNPANTPLDTLQGNGNTINLVANEVLLVDQTYAIEVVNQYACPSFAKQPVGVEVIDVETLVKMPDFEICTQADLQLNSGDLGASTLWTWTGPNGFASTLQNPLRPTITVADSGVYKVAIQSVCPVVEQEIRVGVIDPQKPTPPDTVLCHNNPSLTLNITPDPGYTIKWYANLNDDINTFPAISAPTPSTVAPTDFVYYAIQEHIALGCKSEKQEVKVKISDRPSSIITASAPDICAGSTAIVLVDDTKSDHKYVLYNPANTPLDTLQGNGNTINLVANEVLLVDQTYAIEVVNQYACPSFAKQPVGVEVIDVETLVKMPDFEICTQADLQLNSGDLGASTLWTWTGPNGFASTLQNPLRPTITVADSGVYKVAIQSVCPVVEQEIRVGVIDPQKPTPPDTVLCHKAPSLTLNITPDVGYAIKWYADDVNTAPTISAPTPSTATPTDFVYYAIQEHIGLGCKSEKQKVKVKISDLPSSDILAFAPDICPGITATVLVVDSDIRYTYKLYDVADAGTAIEQLMGNGDTLTFYPNEILNTDTPYYIEIVNTYACASDDRKMSTVHIVDYLEMGPERLPQYQRGKYYDQQLTTNARAPYVFSTSDLLPSGLSLASQGAITGTPPRNGRIDPAEFTVKVEDKDGCVKDQLYVLKSEIFIPQVLTPNGDGKNDHFMRGHKLIIFDRLGIIVFEGEDGWDGTIDGKTAPADTYFYLLFFEDENTGKESQKKGFITLI